MTSITLYRHSISQANEDGICDSGRFDAPLSERGQLLAQACALEVTECPDAIYTSDMNRAAQTAMIFRGVLQEKFGRDIPLITVPGLRGQDQGTLEGMDMRTPQFQLLSIMADKKGPEAFEGESDQTAGLRQLCAVLEVAENARQSGLKKVAVFTHSDTILRLQVEMQALSSQIQSPKNCEGVGPFAAEKIMRDLGWLRPPQQKSAPPKAPRIK